MLVGAVTFDMNYVKNVNSFTRFLRVVQLTSAFKFRNVLVSKELCGKVLIFRNMRHKIAKTGMCFGVPAYDVKHVKVVTFMSSFVFGEL